MAFCCVLSFRTCITKAVNENSKCPECGSFAWLKDLQTNRELLSAVEFCIGLKKAVCSQEQGNILINEALYLRFNGIILLYKQY